MAGAGERPQCWVFQTVVALTRANRRRFAVVVALTISFVVPTIQHSRAAASCDPMNYQGRARSRG